jgi:putative transposase
MKYKKSRVLLPEESEIAKFKFIFEYRFKFRIAKMCKALGVSRSGYYAHHSRGKSKRSLKNKELLKTIKKIHEESHKIYSAPQITKNLPESQKASKGRVARLMRANGIRSKITKKYKATTNSKHNLPVAKNILNRNFTARRPNEKWVSDITYIHTKEGWLYLAAVMDLFGRRIVVWAMDSRMKNRLVSDALKQAVGMVGAS